MSPKPETTKPLATLPPNADKKAREAAIKEAAEKAKKNKPAATITVPPAPTKKKAKEGADKELDATVAAAKKPKKEEADPNMLSVSDIAKELGIDPKRARAKLRSKGQTATEGRWPRVKRDSKEHKAMVELLAPDEEPDTEVEDDETSDEE